MKLILTLMENGKIFQMMLKILLNYVYPKTQKLDQMQMKL